MQGHSSAKHRRCKMAAAKRQYYSELERTLLRELVNKELHVIENKKTDFRAIKQKNDVWLGIAKAFNAEVGVQPRNDKQLRKCWDNMKSRAKTEKSKERRERLQTGGGQVSAVADDDSLKVSAMVAVQIDPLKNQFDDDAATDDVEINDDSDDIGGATCCKPNLKGQRRTDGDSSKIPVTHSRRNNTGMTAAQRIVISNQEEEHSQRMEVIRAQLENEKEKRCHENEQHKLKMEILNVKKQKLLGNRVVPNEMPNSCPPPKQGPVLFGISDLLGM